nr:hypothetical protein B0A51_10036 [Rachicladosporium sp. CCFEE 5018]
MPFTMDPEVGQVMGALLGSEPPPPLAVGDVNGRRERVGGLFAALFSQAPAIPDVSVKTFTTKAEDGHEIGLHWYTKQGASSSPGPAVCYIHGGGMICLGPEHYDIPMKTYVTHTGIPFLLVDYRLAPEVQAPVPVTDSYAGLKYLFDHASELGVDPARIALMGDSAGGGIAASVTHLAKQIGGPKIAKQVLIYPMLDNLNTSEDPDTAPFATWSVDDNKTGWGALLGDKAGSGSVPVTHAAGRASIEDLKGLAPAYIDVGELDIFRDEDLEYARKLGKAGVSVEFHLYPGVPHAFEAFAPTTTIGQAAVGNRLKFLAGL